MKLVTFALVLCLCFWQSSIAQTLGQRASVLLDVQWTAEPPTVTISWVSDPEATGYEVYRKEKNDDVFPQIPEAQYGPKATRHVDASIVPGKNYEYQVVKICTHQLGASPTSLDSLIANYWGFGYANVGVEAVDDARGTVLLLIDETMKTPLSIEIERLQSDLSGEGWEVKTAYLPRTESFDKDRVKTVKDSILAYAGGKNSPMNRALTTVFILGRVAVPYSGNLNPDGHPEHRGAWPADTYYGDIEGTWNDISVNSDNNTTPPNRSENRNIVGDGKFDRSTISGNAELAVGRVDFFGMDSLLISETELLRRYLNKDHAFRSETWSFTKGGIMSDNFGNYGEGFAQAGWRAISLFGGSGSVVSANYLESLNKNDKSYLWSYGTGGGSYQSAGGIGVTNNYRDPQKINSVFTMMFGSYFGDWDSQNNFLRAQIAVGGKSLTCVWAGRPQWYFHHMGLGETIGYSHVKSQNNERLYLPLVVKRVGANQGQLYTAGLRGVHVALMGDPTLTAQQGVRIPPPMTLHHGIKSGVGQVLVWENVPTADAYQIFRRDDDTFNWETLAIVRAPLTTYLDVDGTETAEYGIRSVKLTQTFTGSYWRGGAIRPQTSVNSVESEFMSQPLLCVPNPTAGKTLIAFSLKNSTVVSLSIQDNQGREVASVYSGKLEEGKHSFDWSAESIGGVTSGLYFVRLKLAGDKVVSTPIVVTR